jgi:hypothetical protein
MKKWFTLVVVVCTFALTGSVYAQFTATWALTSDNTVAVTGTQASSVSAAQIIPGSKFSSGTHNSDGFSCSYTTTWPTTPTDGLNIDFPLSPDASSNMTVTGLTMTVKISGSSGSQAVSLAYQVDGTGSWTTIGSAQTVPSGGTSNVTFGTLSQYLVNGHTYVVRLYVYGAASSISASRKVYIKNVAFTGTTTNANVPSVFLSTTALPTFGTVVAGTSSTSQSYTVSGAKLSDNVVITAQTPFLVSTDNSTFTSTLTLARTDSNSLASTTVYVKFSPTTAGGTLTGSITHASTGAGTKTLTVTGTAIATEPTTQSSLTVGTITGTSVALTIAPGNGTSRIITVCEGSVPTWTPSDGKSITGVDANFAAATNQGSATRVIFNAPDSVSRSVVVTGLQVATNYQFAVYEYNGNNGSENYLLTSPGTASTTTLTVPGLSASTAALAFGNVIVGSTSPVKTVSITGKFLSPQAGSLSVVSTGSFLISSDSSSFSQALNVTYSGATLTAAPIYVKFTADSIKNYYGAITVSGGGASDVVINLSGFGRDSSSVISKAIYVAPDGNDVTGTGAIDKPYKSIQGAALKLQAGMTLVLRGGTYAKDSIIIRDKTLSDVTIMSYPGERAVIDASTNGTAGIDVIVFYGNNSKFYGIDVTTAPHNGMWLLGNNNLVENCRFYNCGDSGFKLGAHLETIYPANNFVLNCDAFWNYDTRGNGGNADGFAAKWNIGSGNRFAHCRSYENSDDGWDLWQADSTVTMDSCWCIRNGNYHITSAAGNGNGFKVGGKPVCVPHIMHNCISFDNKGDSGGKGFDQNSNFAGHVMLNCLAWGNSYLDYNFYKPSTNGTLICKNSIQYKGKTSPYIKFVDGVVQNNSWAAQKFQTGYTWAGVTVTDADFVSVDTSLAFLPRNADGSLQVTDLYKLKSTSGLIDKGQDVGIPFYGSAPDIGPFEYGLISGIKEYEPIVGPRTFKVDQNYPNPFNPSTVISYEIPNNSFVTLKVYDILGKEVATLVNEEKSSGIYRVTFDASHLPSGIYIYNITAGKYSQVKKMMLLK